MKRLLVLIALVVFVCFAAMQCGGSGSSSPTSPSVSACQTNNTATVTFENRSASNKTYSVIWDGATLTTLAPTVASQSYTVAAGVTHTLVFRIANSSTNACSSTPTLAQCSSWTYWCTT